MLWRLGQHDVAGTPQLAPPSSGQTPYLYAVDTGRSQRARASERAYLRPDSACASWEAQVFEDHPDRNAGAPAMQRGALDRGKDHRVGSGSRAHRFLLWLEAPGGLLGALRNRAVSLGSLCAGSSGSRWHAPGRLRGAGALWVSA